MYSKDLSILPSVCACRPFKVFSFGLGPFVSAAIVCAQQAKAVSRKEIRLIDWKIATPQAEEGTFSHQDFNGIIKRPNILSRRQLFQVCSLVGALLSLSLG